MRLRRTDLLLLFAACAALGVAVSACSDEAAGDDDDTPITPNRCAIYWARENPIDGTLDFFTVDMPISAWVVTTAQNYGGVQLNARRGIFAYRSPDGSLSAAMGVGETTSGEFALPTVGGTAAGDAIVFSDTAGQILVDARTETAPPLVGTAGVGAFDGVWSDPAATDFTGIDWATSAQMTIVYAGSDIELGGASRLDGMSAYAQCYDSEDTAFAPVPLQGGKMFHQVQQSGSGTRHGKGSR